MNCLYLRFSRILSALFLAFTFSNVAAEKAQVQFTSLSVLILPGTAEDPLTDLEWTLELSSLGEPNAINHELMLAFGDHDYSHEGYFILMDPFSVEPIVMPFILDIPPINDVNGNGIDDFFDPTASVDSIETQGVHPNASNGGEPFTATWSRGAGETIGTVTLDFPHFGLRFDHLFQLSHFTGEFSFERDGSELQGTVSLTNVLNVDDRISGPFSVQVVNTNTLNLSATTWNNGAGSDYLIATNFYDGRFGTNFFSYWVMEDGYLGTGQPDYVDWTMVISSGDANGNGVIDLVEGSSPTNERPHLAIAKAPNGYEITITGTAGRTYWLEYTGTVADATWPNHHVVTLTSSTQTITLPPDGSSGLFFRLREP